MCSVTWAYVLDTYYLRIVNQSIDVFLLSFNYCSWSIHCQLYLFICEAYRKWIIVYNVIVNILKNQKGPEADNCHAILDLKVSPNLILSVVDSRLGQEELRKFEVVSHIPHFWCQFLINFDTTPLKSKRQISSTRLWCVLITRIFIRGLKWLMSTFMDTFFFHLEAPIAPPPPPRWRYHIIFFQSIFFYPISQFFILEIHPSSSSTFSYFHIGYP